MAVEQFTRLRAWIKSASVKGKSKQPVQDLDLACNRRIRLLILRCQRHRVNQRPDLFTGVVDDDNDGVPVLILPLVLDD